MRFRAGPRGLRARIVVAFGAGALLVSAVLAATTFLLARGYLLDQQEDAATAEAYLDADFLRSRLGTAGVEVDDVLAEVSTDGADVVVRSGGSWYSTGLDVGTRDVPASLRRIVEDGSAGRVLDDSPAGPRLVIGIPVAGPDLDVYEIVPLAELHSVLRTLSWVLGAGALVATAAGAASGLWASRRVVLPLEQVAGAATRIASGELTTRLPATDDPDLVAIVGSFNAMVDALSARIERDARFVADVSHELRSPLTSLVTSVEVVAARRHELSPRGAQALDLVEQQLARFRATLDDLLELARLDDAPLAPGRDPVSVPALVREVLAVTGRPAGLLHTTGEPAVVRGDKLWLERAVRNLLDNADRHGGGPSAVRVERGDDAVVLSVDDDGPGIPPEDRARVFERFARGSGAARGSLAGAGLGLAIVADIAARHGGSAWCTTSPGGGARLSLSLPLAES
ncbi:cell wall metabolism sensor histidine kinase WalK [Blastococcus sp. TF02A-26]|uniref:sensor histidine kinase n=1 Tax=Blastococcus sp. TF02A-26 TaxID=2250577 RepID=UPI000DE9602C|nr:HAMP domain-containing sensor histidine kinase [Blastococcus sp. TF02A-26]RBY90624.1 sensor histidine kinase [Blastococcus sp. TF02A-26]